PAAVAPSGCVSAAGLRAQRRAGRPRATERVLARGVDDEAGWLHEHLSNRPIRVLADGQCVGEQFQQKMRLLLRRDGQRVSEPEGRQAARLVGVAVVETLEVVALTRRAQFASDALEPPQYGGPHGGGQ